jgi:acetyltransferase-like isoleucine patch superfamily enzyme
MTVPIESFFRKAFRFAVIRIGQYLGFIETRNDERYKTSHISENVSLGESKLEGNNSIGHDVVFFGNVRIGYGTTIGHNSVLHGGEISIGRYCQFGPYMAIYAVDHPISYLSMYVNKRLFAGELKRFNTVSTVTIGNDVWIGHGASILKGVRIGNGAVVAAGAVVTHDVPGYCIVAGNPAQVIKKRFDDELTMWLQKLEWWNWDPAEIEARKEIFFMDLGQNRSKSIELIKEIVESA